MQLRGRVLRGGRLFKAAMALVMATTIATADVVDASAPVGDTFAVHAVIELDSNGGALEFGSGWDEFVDFSVDVNGSGVVSVNGVAIGDVAGASEVRIDVLATDGDVTVMVFRASCGTLLCAQSGFGAPVAADKVWASGGIVDVLTVG